MDDLYKIYDVFNVKFRKTTKARKKRQRVCPKPGESARKFKRRLYTEHQRLRSLGPKALLEELIAGIGGWGRCRWKTSMRCSTPSSLIPHRQFLGWVRDLAPSRQRSTFRTSRGGMGAQISGNSAPGPHGLSGSCARSRQMSSPLFSTIGWNFQICRTTCAARGPRSY